MYVPRAQRFDARVQQLCARAVSCRGGGSGELLKKMRKAIRIAMLGAFPVQDWQGAIEVRNRVLWVATIQVQAGQLDQSHCNRAAGLFIDGQRVLKQT